MKAIKTVLFVVALLAGIAVHAQEKAVTFGVEAGMNLSNMTQDMNADAKVGFNAGVTLDYAFTPDWYLLTKLKYSMKGTKEDPAEINFSYITLPIHAGYKLNVDTKTKIVFHAGPYLAYAMSGNTKVGGVSVDIFDKDITELAGFKMRRFDFGIGLGIGAEFNKICVGIGYDLGLVNLIDIKDRSKLEFYDDVKGKNSNAYLTVGYKF